jgi:hypothetical protein
MTGRNDNTAPSAWTPRCKPAGTRGRAASRPRCRPRRAPPPRWPGHTWTQPAPPLSFVVHVLLRGISVPTACTHFLLFVDVSGTFKAHIVTASCTALTLLVAPAADGDLGPDDDRPEAPAAEEEPAAGAEHALVVRHALAAAAHDAVLVADPRRLARAREHAPPGRGTWRQRSAPQRPARFE